MGCHSSRSATLTPIVLHRYWQRHKQPQSTLWTQTMHISYLEIRTFGRKLTASDGFWRALTGVDGLDKLEHFFYSFLQRPGCCHPGKGAWAPELRLHRRDCGAL